MSKAKRPVQKKTPKKIILSHSDLVALVNLGNTFLVQGNIRQAIENYRRVLSVNSGFPEVHNNLGVALQQQGDLEAAIKCYQSALAINPKYPDANQNLGLAFKDQGKHEVAIECYQQALLANPNHAEAQFNLGLSLLHLGQLLEGWKYYEARYNPTIRNRLTIPPDFDFPQWQGESLAGKSVLIWSEQGCGDEIQFCRYVSMLKAYGASHVAWAGRASLTDLLSTLKEVDVVLSKEQAKASHKRYDYWTFPLSIPLHCKTTMDTIPAVVPYLYANPKRLKDFAGLDKIKEFKVGLCWKGNPAHQNDKNRSFELATLGQIFKLQNIKFFTLQPNTRTEFLATVGKAAVDIGRDLDETTFADVAALIAHLDLVISCDTSLAHLAGALGKPVWIILPFDADWRWLMNREDSPWYPTVRLFRQTLPNNRDEVFERMETELKRLVNQ